MRDVEIIEEVEQAIDAGDFTFILFSRDGNADRDRLLLGVSRLLRRNEAVRAFHVDLDQMPTAAGRYTVYSTPAYVIYRRGTMVGKVEGGFSPTHVARTIAGLLG
ncbi:MAG: thioredoxin family protein [Alkalispirochaetaceae bacterium]